MFTFFSFSIFRSISAHQYICFIFLGYKHVCVFVGRKMEAEKGWGLGRPSSQNMSRMRSGSIRRSLSRAASTMEEVFGTANQSRRALHAEEDEEALKWAAIEKLPTYSRLRTSILKSFVEDENEGSKVVHKEVDVRRLDMSDRQQLIDKLFRVAEEDNEKFLKKFRDRIQK